MIDSACAVGAHYLTATVYRVTRGASEQAEDRVNALSHQAISALRTVDDALRHYLPRAVGLRILRAPGGARGQPGGADPHRGRRGGRWCPTAGRVPTRAVLEAHTAALCARLDGSDPVAALPYQRRPGAGVARRIHARGRGQLEISAALPLVTVAANVGELELTYPPLLAIEPLPHQ